MEAVTISVELPEDVAQALSADRPALEHELLMAAIVHGLRHGLISLGRAAELANVTIAELTLELGRRRVQIVASTTDELRDEVRRLG